MGRTLQGMDSLILALDSALRTLFAPTRASRPCPTVPETTTQLDPAERREAAALMRVNHVGEVCAQALYASQALATRDPALRRHFEAAAQEETDHLAWTRQRLDELQSRPSLLNPLWFAGAFGLGLLAGRLGDRVSLGFVVETERQVEAHLDSHMNRLPAADHASRAIVAQMKADERAHADQALAAGAVPLPPPVQMLMRAAAKVMTTTAHHV
jgi:ubiquinone biosynthesis monooxygenase Coq7